MATVSLDSPSCEVSCLILHSVVYRDVNRQAKGLHRLKYVGALERGLAYLSRCNSGWFCHTLGAGGESRRRRTAAGSPYFSENGRPCTVLSVDCTRRTWALRGTHLRAQVGKAGAREGRTAAAARNRARRKAGRGGEGAGDDPHRNAELRRQRNGKATAAAATKRRRRRLGLRGREAVAARYADLGHERCFK
jgi:hypothetical protein